MKSLNWMYRSMDVLMNRNDRKKARHCDERSEEAILPFSSRVGFTLIELVLVITIVIVLSVISGPIYRSYAYKARQAEGYALLGTIRSAQESYYGEYGRFLYFTACQYDESSTGLTCNEEILGIDARPNKYYTSFCVGFSSVAGIRLDTSEYAHAFAAYVKGNGAANLYMLYNRTSGVTMFSGNKDNAEY